MDIFTLFSTREYTFVQTEPVGADFQAIDSWSATGIVKHRDGKHRDGKTNSGRSESYEVQTTLHIRPDEPFLDAIGGALELVGHAVNIDGEEYRIDGVTTGTDFDTGEVKFYRATLSKATLWVSGFPQE